MPLPTRWPYGLNFYGYHIKASDPHYAAMTGVLDRAAASLQQTHQRTATDLFSSASGLELLKPLRRFNRRMIDRLAATAVPHALEVAELTDATSVFKLLGTSGSPWTPAMFCARTRSTLHRMMGQQLGETDGSGALTVEAEQWLDAVYKPLVRYQMQLFRGVFIDRNGTGLTFSLKTPQTVAGAAALATNLAAESPQIAGEVMYALIECLGDLAFQTPAYDPSTGQTAYKSYACFLAGVIVDIIKPGAPWSYPSGSATHDAADIAGAVIAFASQSVEGSIKSSVGALIRGASLAGINNEALAEIGATAISVAVKKLMEAFTYRVLVEFIADPSLAPTFKDDVFDRLRKLLLT